MTFFAYRFRFFFSFSFSTNDSEASRCTSRCARIHCANDDKICNGKYDRERNEMKGNAMHDVVHSKSMQLVHYLRCKRAHICCHSMCRRCAFWFLPEKTIGIATAATLEMNYCLRNHCRDNVDGTMRHVSTPFSLSLSRFTFG